jgi:hypothetical protein
MQIIVETVLSVAHDSAIPRRISLYRALADFCGDQQEAAILREAAEGLERCDASTRQMVMSLTEETLS